MTTATLIGLGRWRDLPLLQPLLPDAAWFVDPTWTQAERQRTLQHLKQGRPLRFWMGYDECEFRCGLPGSHKPGVELTDGTYVWPEMLIHQVEQHHIRLPAQFVEHALSQVKFPTAKAAAADERTATDYAWWQSQQGWQQDISNLSLLSPDDVRRYLRRFDRKMIEFGSEPTNAVAVRDMLVQQLRQRLG